MQNAANVIENPNTGAISDDVAESLYLIRSRIVNTSLVVLAVLTFPTVVAIIARGNELVWNPFSFMHIVLYVFVLLPAAVWHRRFSFTFRTGILLSVSYLAGVAGILSGGLVSAGILLLIFACIITTALFGRQWGYWCVLACTLPICAVGIFIVSGQHTVNFDIEQFVVAPTSWITRIFWFAGISAAMVHGSGMLHSHLLGSVEKLSDSSRDLSEANTRLRDEIAEREQIQVDLKSSEERYRLLSENVTDVVSILGLDMSPVYVSPSIFEQRGFTPSEWMDLPAEQLITPKSLASITSEIAEALTQFERGEVGPGDSQTTEFEGYRKDGSTVWLERVTSFLLDDAGKPTQIIGVTRDISARKLAEEEKQLLEGKMLQMQKMESLGLLAGGIAHDFNNFLASMMGNADLARRSISRPAEAEEYLDQVVKATERAADLCRQLLAYSGKGRFVVEPVDVGEQVRDSEKLLRVSVPKSVYIQCEIAERLPCIEADASQIQQVIMNLVINAGEAIGEGEGRISLYVKSQECDESYLRSIAPDRQLNPGRYVTLEVTDSGPGIPDEAINKIFDPFFTSKDTGHGLGLAAVMGIVRAHRGVIKVYSEVAKGTTFRVFFPATEELKKTERSPTPGDADVRISGTVLIVDDDAHIRATAAAMLTTGGFDVLLAEDGYKAVEVYREHSDEIQVVLLDLSMPGIDGEETYRRLKTVNPNVRVILTSGFNEQETTSRFVGKGLASFIQKPYRIVDLIHSIEAVLTNLADEHS